MTKHSFCTNNCLKLKNCFTAVVGFVRYVIFLVKHLVIKKFDDGLSPKKKKETIILVSHVLPSVLYGVVLRIVCKSAE